MIQKEVQKEVERFLSNTKEVGTDYRYCPPRRFPSVSNSLKLVLRFGNVLGLLPWQWLTKQLTYQPNCHLNLSKKPSSLPKCEPNLLRYTSKLYVPPFPRNIPIFKRLFKNEFPTFSDDISLLSVREGNGRKCATKPDIVVSSLTF